MRSIAQELVDACEQLDYLKRFHQRFSYKRKRFLPRLSQLITSTKQHLKVFVDDEWISIFQEGSVLESLREILKQDVPVLFVFHLSDDFSEALGKLRNEYPVLSSLFDEYDGLRIYWRPRNPIHNYCLSDERNICLSIQSRFLKRRLVVFRLSRVHLRPEEFPRRVDIDYEVKRDRKFFAEMEEAFDGVISSGKYTEVQRQVRV
jgi:hypothetical protein